MKKTISVVLTILLVVGLFSCSTPEETQIESSMPMEPQTLENSFELQDPSLLRSQDRHSGFFIEAENYYYYLYEDKVYFSTKDDPTFYLLCGKPDCSHSGTDCNAYAGSALGWWNGKLYGVCEYNLEFFVISMELDGSNHTQIAKIIEPMDSNGQYGGAYYFFFHDGYLYYYVLANYRNSFFCVSLSTGETTRLMEEELNDGGAILEKWRYEGDNLYMILYDTSQEQYLYRLSGAEGEKVCRWEFGKSRWDIKGDTIYLYSAEYQAFCEYDLSSGTLTKKRDFTATYGAAYYDKEYIYLVTWDDYDGNRVIHFFDWNYQLLSEIELTNVQDLMYAAGDKFFFTNMPSHPIAYYIPKTAIVTGELELIEVTNPYSYR